MCWQEAEIFPQDGVQDQKSTYSGKHCKAQIQNTNKLSH